MKMARSFIPLVIRNTTGNSKNSTTPARHPATFPKKPDQPDTQPRSHSPIMFVSKPICLTFALLMFFSHQPGEPLMAKPPNPYPINPKKTTQQEQITSLPPNFQDIPDDLYRSWHEFKQTLIAEDSTGKTGAIYDSLIQQIVDGEFLEDLQGLPLFQEAIFEFSNTLSHNGLILEAYRTLLYLEKTHPDFNPTIILINKGSYFQSIGSIETSIEYYQEAALLAQDRNEQENLLLAYNNLGTLYQQLDDFESALRYYEKSLDLATQPDAGAGAGAKVEVDVSNVLLLQNNMGTVYRNLGDPQKAINLYLSSLSGAEQGGFTILIAQTLSNLGNAYKDLGEYERAADALYRSLDFSKENQILYGEVVNYVNLGSLFIVSGDYDRALDALTNAKNIAQFADLPAIALPLNDEFVLLYERLGDEENAQTYRDKYDEIQREIFEMERLQRVEISRLSFELQQMEKDFGLARDELAVIKNSFQGYIIFSSFFGLMLLALLAHTTYRRRKVKILYDRLKEMLDRESKEGGTGDRPRLKPLGGLDAFSDPSLDARISDPESVASETSSDVSTATLTNAPSGIPSDIPSNIPSDLPSNLTSNSSTGAPKSLAPANNPSIQTDSHHHTEEEIPEVYQFLYQDIIKLLRQEELFRLPDLTLSEVAQRIGTNRRYVSEAINLCAKMNFSTLLNTYRVEYACEQIISSVQPISMKQLMTQCGYKSQSTFYRSFRTITGITPKEFQRVAKKKRQR